MFYIIKFNYIILVVYSRTFRTFWRSFSKKNPLKTSHFNFLKPGNSSLVVLRDNTIIILSNLDVYPDQWRLSIVQQ